MNNYNKGNHGQHKMWSWASLLMKCSLKVTMKRGLSWQRPQISWETQVSKKNPRRAASWSPASSWVESRRPHRAQPSWVAVAQPSNFWERSKTMEGRECFQISNTEFVISSRQMKWTVASISHLTPIKINSTKITDLHIKGKTITLKESRGKILRSRVCYKALRVDIKTDTHRK